MARRRSLTSSSLTTISTIALIVLTLATIVSAHVPPAPTTTVPPPTPTTPSSPSPPKDPSTQTPPSSPTTPSTPSSSSPPTPPLPTTPTTVPSSPPGDVNDPPCCAVLKGVPGCKEQIYKAYTTVSGGASTAKVASVNIGGSYIKIGQACCNIINTVGDGCWKMMFPKCPVAMFFRGVCSVFGTPEMKPSLLNSMQCLTALRQIPGCMKQVNETASLLTQFSFKGVRAHKEMHAEVVGMGQSCCKAAGGISDSCWQEIYPKYPAVGRVVKGVCSVVDGSGIGGGLGGVRGGGLGGVSKGGNGGVSGVGGVGVSVGGDASGDVGIGGGKVKSAILQHQEERLKKKAASDNVNFDAKLVKLPVNPPPAAASDNVNFDAKLVKLPVNPPPAAASDNVNFDAKLVKLPVNPPPVV